MATQYALPPTPCRRRRRSVVDYKFRWNFEQDREQNFRRWWAMNNAERDAYNIAQELEAGAREIFNQMEARWRSEADQKRNERSWWTCPSSLTQTASSG
jgi:hypothetical protein